MDPSISHTLIHVINNVRGQGQCNTNKKNVHSFIDLLFFAREQTTITCINILISAYELYIYVYVKYR